MQSLEYDHSMFQPGRESEADSQLLVRFFLREKEDKDASEKEGRPIFKEREYVEIRVPGKRDALACRPATPGDIKRFPRHYEMFQKRIEPPQEGTPLSEWPQMSRSMAEELAFLQVKTVEQFANMNDNDAANIRGGLSFKQKAKAFLEYSDQTKLISEKQALEERLAAQEKEMAELRAMIGAQPDPKADVKAEEAVNEMHPGEQEPEEAAQTRPRKSRRAKKEE